METRKNKVKPTPRQIAAKENILKGMSKRKAMIEAGYSEVTASHPKQNLIEARGFEVLAVKLDEASKLKYGISSDDMGTKAVVDALEATKPYGKEGALYPDHKTRLEAANKVFEIKGYVKHDEQNLTQINVGGDLGVTFTRKGDND